MNWLWNLVWPADATAGERWTSAVRAAVTSLLLMSTVLSIVGLVHISRALFYQLVLVALGIWLFSFVVDTDERRQLLINQKGLLEHFRFATQSRVREVPSQAIAHAIEEALESAQFWLFKGGSGRYLRAATLPLLSQITHQDVRVSIHILDPRDDSLCREYARYRAVGRSERVRREDEHDHQTILTDLLANIYAAGWYRANSRIQPEVVLLRSFSPVRYDLSSNALFVTVADPSSPALIAEAGTWYFDSIKDEISQNIHGHPAVVLPATNQAFPRERSSVDASVVREALGSMSVSDPITGQSRPLLQSIPADIDFDEIAQKVFLRESPY